MKKILVIGSSVVDIIINLDKLPTRKGDVHVTSQEMTMGGCAYIVFETIRHFDVPATLFSPIGTGMYGDYVRKIFQSRDIVSPIPTPNQDNGCCYCFVEQDGERTFVSHHGAEYLIYKEWLDTLDVSQIHSIYICGLEIEEKTGSEIVAFLEQHPEIPVYFAPGPRLTRIDASLMQRIFALSPIVHLNEDEICDFADNYNILEAAFALYKKTNNTIIITAGEKGAYYFDGEKLNLVAGCQATHIVDTIGAGDSHVGAVMAGVYQNQSLSCAIENANKTACAVVQNKGGIISKQQFSEAFTN